MWFLSFTKYQESLKKQSTLQQATRESDNGSLPGNTASVISQSQLSQGIKAPYYSRKQNLVMLQGCFFTLH